jgi:hypothetical protein
MTAPRYRAHYLPFLSSEYCTLCWMTLLQDIAVFSLLSLLEAKVPHALPSFPVLKHFYTTLCKRCVQSFPAPPPPLVCRPAATSCGHECLRTCVRLWMWYGQGVHPRLSTLLGPP